MKVNKKLLLKILFTVFISTFAAAFAQAVLTFPSTTGYTTLNDLVVAVVNWFLSVTAGVAIFFIIIGGIYYLTAFGDDKRMQEGKKIITYAVYGLILILVSYSIVTTINAIIFS